MAEKLTNDLKQAVTDKKNAEKISHEASFKERQLITKID